MRDPYPLLSPDELTALRRIGGGLGKHAQLYHAYTLIALELVAFDPEGRLVATEAGHQLLRDADAERAVGQDVPHAVLALDPNWVVAGGYLIKRDADLAGSLDQRIIDRSAGQHHHSQAGQLQYVGLVP
jgi:hypothetical protein